MAEPTNSRKWQDIDQTGKSEEFVGYLGTVTALDSVQIYKRKTYDHLDVTEGHQVLDVGCGIGDDVRALAQIVGELGQVIGVDSSSEMVRMASNHPDNGGLNIRFQQGNVLELDFEDNTFDGSRSDRVFQHLTERERALSEMIRVTKPGGRICVADTDWGTLVVDMPDVMLTSKITQYIATRQQSGWSGRQLLRLLRQAGLAELRFDVGSAILTDLDSASRIFHLRDGVEELVESGELAPDEAERWIGYLEVANRKSVFFSALCAFLVSGRKP